MIDRALNFARANIILTAIQHAVGGFGLAIVLQWYIQETAFAPLWLGWVMVAFSVGIHLYEAGLALSRRAVTRTTRDEVYSAPV